MPSKKETPEEKSQRLTQKGEAILAQADFNKCVSCMRNRPEVIASVKATLVAKKYWNLASKTTNTQAKQECDPAELKEMTDDLQMRQELEVVQAAHPELVAIKILDVVLHRSFTCPRLTPPKHSNALCSLAENVAFTRVF